MVEIRPSKHFETYTCISICNKNMRPLEEPCSEATTVVCLISIHKHKIGVSTWFYCFTY